MTKIAFAYYYDCINNGFSSIVYSCSMNLTKHRFETRACINHDEKWNNGECLNFD